MIPVVAAALIDPRGAVLVQRRPRRAAHGGLWEFPGGKVEPGETALEALHREIAEELGVVLDSAAVHPFRFAALPGESCAILLFTCRAWNGEPRCLAAEEIAWTMPTALPGLAMPPLDLPLARALAGAGATAI